MILVFNSGMASNGSGKNLLLIAHNGSSSIIEEEEEMEVSGTSKPKQASNTAVSNDTPSVTNPALAKEEGKSMSYLALTKLGMGKKEGGDPKLENMSNPNLTTETEPKKPSPKESKKPKKSNIKDGVDVKEKRKTKPMISLLR